jgi:hypothetical protein
MARDITVTFEDGTTHVYRQAPDDVTPEAVQQRAAQEFGKQVRALDGGQKAVQVGSALRDIPRQVGLTARYGIEGLGRASEIITEPIRQIVVNPALSALGVQGRAAPTGQAAAGLADTLGLPSPRTPNERVVGDAARLGFGGGGVMGGARAAAQATAGATRQTFNALAANPAIQTVGATTAGLAGGSVREAGGGDVEQFLASLAGAVGGGVAAARSTDVAKRGAQALRALATPRQDQLMQAESAVELAARRSGIDWAAVAPRAKQQLRDEVAEAMRTGKPLNADALRRLIVFRQTRTTPTVGMLTQNPVTITREQNMMRAAANMDDPALQQLPLLQNRNINQLLGLLDDAGARSAPDNMAAGMRAVNALDSLAAREQANIGGLYQAARDTSGRSLPLEGGTFTRVANELLDQENVGSFLPPDIARKMNDIATGKYPLTVDVAEQLKTSIGRMQRSTADGNMRFALGLVRRALDQTPLQGAQPVNPGMLPAALNQAPPSVQAGEQSILAFNQARTANRQWMQRVEGNKALQAVVDGVEPDQFFQKFVVGSGASAADVRKLSAELDKGSQQALKQAIARHLKDKGTSNTDDITKFSGAAYRQALRDIGDDKLAVFFGREELAQLKAIGDAAKYMQAQPAGSAVNNSNSGALMMARGYEFLDRLAGFIPLGGREVIRGKITQPMLQRQALDPLAALQQAAGIPRTPVRVNPLLAVAFPAPVQGSED